MRILKHPRALPPLHLTAQRSSFTLTGSLTLFPFYILLLVFYSTLGRTTSFARSCDFLTFQFPLLPHLPRHRTARSSGSLSTAIPPQSRPFTYLFPGAIVRFDPPTDQQHRCSSPAFYFLAHHTSTNTWVPSCGTSAHILSHPNLHICLRLSLTAEAWFLEHKRRRYHRALGSRVEPAARSA